MRVPAWHYVCIISVVMGNLIEQIPVRFLLKTSFPALVTFIEVASGIIAIAGALMAIPQYFAPAPAPAPGAKESSRPSSRSRSRKRPRPTAPSRSSRPAMGSSRA